MGGVAPELPHDLPHDDQQQETTPESATPTLVEVAFRGNRKEFFTWAGSAPVAVGAWIIVEADRGEDLGRVHSVGTDAERRNTGCAHGCGDPVRRALRLASKRDVRQGNTLATLNDDARKRAAETVRAAGLQMKISDAEWQWDKKKLTLYFTADKRVDFRNLVRELAAMFRTRIELKQIGVRDEAKRLDGIGRCGRQYCSAAWLPELRPVNLGVAKDQRLSLNPSQISGACGRLMCSLRYEHDFYVESRRRFPKEGRVVTTPTGEERVASVDLFRETVTLRAAEGATRVVPLAQFNQELAGTAPVRPECESEETVEEISPELMYTAEFAVPEPRLVILTETVETPLPGGEAAAGSRRPRRRRRGRRSTDAQSDDGAGPASDE